MLFFIKDNQFFIGCRNESTFAELERTIEGISRKVLAENLKSLVKMGILNKKGIPSTGYPVEYSLSNLGLSLLPVFYDLKKWIIENEEVLIKNLEAKQ